mgnify:CR=1 FL=1
MFVTLSFPAVINMPVGDAVQNAPLAAFQTVKLQIKAVLSPAVEPGFLVDWNIVSKREHVAQVVAARNGDLVFFVANHLAFDDAQGIVFGSDRHKAEVKHKVEHELAVRLSKRRNAVISTGGGTVKNTANMAALKSSGVLVCLKADVDTVLERTQNRGTRPVLDREDKGNRRQAVEKLLKERESLYSQADFTVDTSELSPLQVVELITKTLKTRGVLHA